METRFLLHCDQTEGWEPHRGACYIEVGPDTDIAGAMDQISGFGDFTYLVEAAGWAWELDVDHEIMFSCGRGPTANDRELNYLLTAATREAAEAELDEDVAATPFFVYADYTGAGAEFMCTRQNAAEIITCRRVRDAAEVAALVAS